MGICRAPIQGEFYKEFREAEVGGGRCQQNLHGKDRKGRFQNTLLGGRLRPFLRVFGEVLIEV